MIPKITIFYGSWYRYIVAVFTSFSMYFLHTKHTIFTTMPIENYNFLIVKITGNSSNFGYLLLLFLLFKKKLEICFEDLIQIQWHYCKNSMFGMQKIHRKTCKNCYFIPLPTTTEHGNFRTHSSLNLILFSLHLIHSFESQKYIEKVWEKKVWKTYLFYKQYICSADLTQLMNEQTFVSLGNFSHLKLTTYLLTLLFWIS